MFLEGAYNRIARFLEGQMQEFYADDYVVPSEEFEEVEDYGYPEMFEVQSSNVHSIGFDHAHSTLYVRFHNGSLYIYGGVPEEVWLMFFNADSKGSFLWQFIRDVYGYERIE